ncbi:hypothetical protein SUGI_0671600 [Cryptomeria japonica]|nr:hypothetical protein SUGI_0671600 [Cryptomeria japonica]
MTICLWPLIGILGTYVTGANYEAPVGDTDAMHTFCANASPSIPHPLTPGNLQLLSSPVCRDSLWCPACEKSVLG